MTVERSFIIAAIISCLVGCPESERPSELPKPDDPSAGEKGPDTVPPTSPRPTSGDPNAPPLSH